MWASFRFTSAALLAFAGLAFAGPTPPAPAPRYARSTVHADVPAVTLVDQRGERVALRDALAQQGPMLVQFIFTTCGTICPVLTQTAAATRREVPGLRIVSISIDPDEDTPARLFDYARRHGADERWRFLTGTPDDSIAAQRAFGAWTGSKMRHLPLSFLRASPAQDWLRVEGSFTANDLAAEWRALAPAAGDVAGGRRLYRDGVLASGATLSSRGGAAGADAACATCHRRSGYGGVEGRAFVPPVGGAALFATPEPRRVDRFRALFQEELAPDVLARLRAATVRPAYTSATFAQALEGRASDGRALDALMPRYDLAAADRANLEAYLRALDEAPAGVDGQEIHFATVVAGDVPAAHREAMLAVMQAWLKQRNAENAHRDARPPNPMGYEDDLPSANRAWTLDVWTLAGDARDWPAQLAEHQRERPVFALLGGLGDWRAVQAFCEARHLPCVLSLTDAPPREDGEYTLYLSGGLPLEARTLARHLADAWPSLEARQLVQVGDAAAAAALRTALAGTAVPVPADRWSTDGAPSVAVLWLDAEGLRSAAKEVEKGNYRRVYVSRALAGDAVAAWPAALRDKTVLVDRYALPTEPLPQAYRARAWLRSHGAAGDDEAVRLSAYYVMSATESAVAQLLDRWSGELLIETIEREAEVVPNPGPYPSVSLGPGQRVAAKRCRLVRYAGEGLEAVAAP